MSRFASLHASDFMGALYVTGGGSRLLADLLEVPGASETVLEARIPYAHAALSALLGGAPERACSSLVARSLAVVAYERAVELGASRTSAFGFGLTASVKTTRPKRGKFRAHMALQTGNRTQRWRMCIFEGGTRLQQERMVALAAGHAILEGLRLSEEGEFPFEHSETATGTKPQVNLLAGRVSVVGEPSGAIMPGSFNPLHAAHAEMRRIAELELGTRVRYELCVRNIDKLSIDYISLGWRTRQFQKDDLILTSLPRFIEKAEVLFPDGGAWFVVGVDTLERIAMPQYYENEDVRDTVVRRFAERGDKFLVFGRAQESGLFRDLAALELPSAMLELCVPVPESRFRQDVSSRGIRSRIEVEAD